MAKYVDTNYLFKCQTCRHFDGDECDTFCDSYECYSPDMSKIPTADVVEVKRGKWIKKGNEKKCSVCEFIYYSNNDEWNYCPNCGAKMGRGTSDGQDNAN